MLKILSLPTNNFDGLGDTVGKERANEAIGLGLHVSHRVRLVVFNSISCTPYRW